VRAFIDPIYLTPYISAQVDDPRTLHRPLVIPIRPKKKNEEIFLVNKDKPLILPHDSEALFILTTIRDEAHRFAIKEHRRLRLKSINQNDLLSIQGIGDKTVSNLMKEFDSLTRISKASYDDLLVVLKPSIAKKVYEFFNGKY